MLDHAWKKSLSVSVALALAACAGGTAAQPTARPAAQPAEQPRYQLQRLSYLSRVILLVKDNYADPSRVRPQVMVVAALEEVAKVVEELTIRSDATSRTLTLAIGTSTLDVELAGVRSIWEVRAVLGRAMAFLEPNLPPNRDRRELEYAATRGLLSTLDAHSTLLEPSAFPGLGTREPIGSVGLVFAIRASRLTVVKVLRASPAERAGLAPGDVITDVDGHPTVNVTLGEAVEWLRGPVGSEVEITWTRAAQPPRRTRFIRQLVSIESVASARLLGDGIAYVRVVHLSASAVADLRAAIAARRAESDGTLRGLVLDLRGNSGGLLDQAVALADLFLAQGDIVEVRGDGERAPIHERKSATAGPGDLLDLPLAVLVDSHSAAGTELVAAALRERGRAVLLGERTFGSGSIQVVYDMSDSRSGPLGVKITVASFRTPGGDAIEGAGVVPDIVLRSVCAGKAPARDSAPAGRAAAELTLPDHSAACSDPDAEVEPATDEAVRFARDVLARAASSDRARLLEAALGLVRERHSGT